MNRPYALVLLALSVPALCGADWPHFLGPSHDGSSPEKGLLRAWPKDGPPVVWSKPVGEGFSGPVLAEGKLILFHRIEDKEVVACLDPATGKEVWKYSYPTAYEDDFGKGNGPRATPVIAGGRVYTLGAEGRLTCLELASGKKVWDRALLKEYQVPRSFFGVGTTPLIEGKHVLVNVGGKKAGIVAFDSDTGKELWRATDDGASYSSPVAATFDGQRYAIFLTRQGVVLLDPKDGAVRYQKRWRARINASVNAASPLVAGDLIFFSASYDTGALVLRVRKGKVEEVWSNDESMSNHYNTCVQHEGYLYGYHGRQEEGAALRCVELKTGKVRWEQKRYGCGSTVQADGLLITLTEGGELVLAEATPQAYREKARARVFDSPPCRAPLALVEGRLYGRDGARLVCFNLKK